MNEARFVELLAAYGADLSRWPEDDRGTAAAFLEAAPHRVKDIWESERAFDHLLALEKDSPASIALETQVLSAAPSPLARRPAGILGLLAMPRWIAGAAMAASLAVGFAVGYAGEAQNKPVNDYANLLSLSGGGAGSVFLTVMADGEH
jgi:hypothetical protein